VPYPGGAFTKLRFTFYAGNDPAQYNGMIGISELHFIHPEATTPYANLIGMNNKNGKIGIGIGTDNPQTMLHLRYSYNDITPHLPIIRFEETYSTRPYRRYIDITGGFSFDVKNESNTNLLSISPYGFDLKLGGTNFHLGEGNSIIDEGKSIYFSGGAASSFTFRNDNGSSTIICGSLWAKDEVVVQTSNPWPDYVFAPEYKLMPLKELEIFIKNNKHLPGVHSANKIKEEGVKLSENIVILLQKIEGLTLYTIKQQEEIDNLKSQMKSFNNK
jgi:hypothetical protein